MPPQRIDRHAPEYLRNVVRVITETGLRVKKELLPMRREQVDLANATVWIPDGDFIMHLLQLRSGYRVNPA